MISCSLAISIKPRSNAGKEVILVFNFEDSLAIWLYFIVKEVTKLEILCVKFCFKVFIWAFNCTNKGFISPALVAKVFFSSTGVRFCPKATEDSESERCFSHCSLQYRGLVTAIIYINFLRLFFLLYIKFCQNL